MTNKKIKLKNTHNNNKYSDIFYMEKKYNKLKLKFREKACSSSKDSSWNTNQKNSPKCRNKKFTKRGNKHSQIDREVDIVKKKVNRVLHIRKVHIQPVEEIIRYEKKFTVRHPSVKVKKIKKIKKNKSKKIYEDIKSKKIFEFNSLNKPTLTKQTKSNESIKSNKSDSKDKSNNSNELTNCENSKSNKNTSNKSDNSDSSSDSESEDLLINQKKK